MKKENKQGAHLSKLTAVPHEDFRDLTERILLCANKVRPSVDFLTELSDVLVSFSSCDVLQFCLKERGFCSRWETTQSPRRLCRLSNISFGDLEMQAKNGSTFSKDTFNPEITSKKNHYASVASFPLVADQELVGLMCLKNRQPNFFNEDVVKQYQRISQTVAIALVFHDVQLQQRERVKELTCLYEINRTVTGTQLDMDTILASIVKSLPPAWQYPDIAAAQIVLDDKIYSTNEKAIARHSQKASIWVDGRQCGSVEVFYTQDKPELDEGPFLLEERNLIDTIAREVETIIRRKRAEKDRGKLQEQLRHADRLATIGQLAAGVAHELNEPLGGILGFSQLAKNILLFQKRCERT